jgi:hypothetical protein
MWTFFSNTLFGPAHIYYFYYHFCKLSFCCPTMCLYIYLIYTVPSLHFIHVYLFFVDVIYPLSTTTYHSSLPFLLVVLENIIHPRRSRF